MNLTVCSREPFPHTNARRSLVCPDPATATFLQRRPVSRHKIHDSALNTPSLTLLWGRITAHMQPPHTLNMTQTKRLKYSHIKAPIRGVVNMFSLRCYDPILNFAVQILCNTTLCAWARNVAEYITQTPFLLLYGFFNL